MGLKLLHISDIHFKNYGENGVHDLDKDIQKEIEFDLEKLKSHYGKIDIIVIGGDIAFSGNKKEYADADIWIKKICSVTGCAEENVLTVPGNHDIDRSSMAVMVKDVHETFRAYETRPDLDDKLFKYLKDGPSAKALLAPLANYNEFAQKYGSIPKKENELFWEKEFQLDCSILKIRGVNSAIISDERDDQHSARLILSSHQSNIVRDKGVIYLVVCHHPPDWLFDGDHAQTDFNARARLQLFGHKHSFGIEVVDSKSVILSAGAMQPERNKDGWEPRYNVIDLSIPSVLQPPFLKIRLYKRMWNKATKKFVADFSDGETIYQSYSLELTEDEIPNIPVGSVPIENELKIEDMAEPIINLGNPDPMRRLAYLFLGLPYHKKINVAVDLGLIDDTDTGLDEIQKSQTYLKRVIERKLLPALWEKVSAATGENTNTLNPFIKQQR